MRTALLACSVVICCCAVLAWQPAKASADRGRARPRRAQGHPDRQPHPRPPRPAAPEGEPPRSRAPRRAHRGHAAPRLPEPRVQRRHGDGHRVRRYTGTQDWVGENIAADPGRATARKARADVDELAAAPRRAAVAVRPPHRRRQAPRQARQRARGRLHRRSLLARLSAGERGACRIASPRDELVRPRPGVPDADARPADRVAPDAERDLADRLRALRRRRGARLAGPATSSAGSRSSSARSATRSTAATRGCRARARRSAPSSTRRSTASRRASC